MALLARYLTPNHIRTLRSRSKEGAIRELAGLLAPGGPREANKVVRAIHERERNVSSWVAPGIAIPHAKLPAWKGIDVAVGRSRRGVSWDSSDGNPVNLVFLIVSGDDSPDEHVMLLAEIARTLRDRALVRLILTARTSAETWSLLVTRGWPTGGRSR